MTQVIAPGPPALTDEAADRALDLIDFMAAVVRGIDTIDVTPSMRERWRIYLVGSFPGLSPTQRAWYATADTTFANLVASWDSLGAQQQEANRANWAVTLPSVLQFAQPVLGGATSAAPPMPAPSRSSVGDLITTLRQGQDAQAQEMYELAGGGEQGLIAMERAKAEHQLINNQLLAEMSKLRFESMQAIFKK